MTPKFNLDRPKVSDEEINKHQDFAKLVKQFKEQSIKRARGDESWWQNKKIRYSTIIAGVTVICTITYLSLFTNKKSEKKINETIITQKSTPKNSDAKTSKPFINAPSQKLKIGYSAYTVNNSKGGNITHKTATKIKVPQKSFVDKNGKEIIGDVTIEYREFHDLGDIIAGGIPMGYDSGGTKYNLESAGMFDIRGYQNGEPVFIDPKKTVEVQLVSASDENRFNQYYLDSVKGNWQYLNKDQPKKILNASFNPPAQQKPMSSPKIVSLTNEIEKLIPKKIDSVKFVFTNKIEKLPKAKSPATPNRPTPGRPSFKLEGSYDEFPELSTFDNVLFEVGPENKNYSKEFHDITWSDVKVSQGPVKGKNYLLTLTYRNKMEKLVVYPVLGDADFAKAEKTHSLKLKEYESQLARREAEEKRLMVEMEAKQAAYIEEQTKKRQQLESERARLFANYNAEAQNELSSNFNSMGAQVKASRIFQVTRFGVYNSDCPHVPPMGNEVKPVFVINEKNKTVEADFIYLVDHTKKSVYALNKEEGFRLRYSPGNVYSICVFNKNKLFLCDKKSFSKSAESGANKFFVSPLPDHADNLVDFKKALEI